MKQLFDKFLYFFRLIGKNHSQKVRDLHSPHQQLDSLDKNYSPNQQPSQTTLQLPNSYPSHQHTVAPKPPTPHYRRIQIVYAALDSAPENLTYNQLIDYVRKTTGVGCSRKLISKWRKAPKLSLATTTNSQELAHTA
jgi:hypothetical protein